MTKLNNILQNLKEDNFNPATHGAVIAIIKNQDNKYLIIQRSSTDEDGAGLWDLAGGSCDSDDVHIDCIREVSEETGLDLHVDNLIFYKHLKYICPWKNEDKVSFIFLAENINSDDIILSHEHDDFKWVNIQELKSYEFYKDGLTDLINELEGEVN